MYIHIVTDNFDRILNNIGNARSNVLNDAAINN